MNDLNSIMLGLLIGELIILGYLKGKDYLHRRRQSKLWASRSKSLQSINQRAWEIMTKQYELRNSIK